LSQNAFKEEAEANSRQNDSNWQTTKEKGKEELWHRSIS
jgi:hypothetical protein